MTLPKSPTSLEFSLGRERSSSSTSLQGTRSGNSNPLSFNGKLVRKTSVSRGTVYVTCNCEEVNKGEVAGAKWIPYCFNTHFRLVITNRSMKFQPKKDEAIIFKPYQMYYKSEKDGISYLAAQERVFKYNLAEASKYEEAINHFVAREIRSVDNGDNSFFIMPGFVYTYYPPEGAVEAMIEAQAKIGFCNLNIFNPVTDDIPISSRSLHDLEDELFKPTNSLHFNDLLDDYVERVINHNEINLDTIIIFLGKLKNYYKEKDKNQDRLDQIDKAVIKINNAKEATRPEQRVVYHCFDVIADGGQRLKGTEKERKDLVALSIRSLLSAIKNANNPEIGRDRNAQNIAKRVKDLQAINHQNPHIMIQILSEVYKTSDDEDVKEFISKILSHSSENLKEEFEKFRK